MKQPEDISGQIAAIQDLLNAKFGVKRRPLPRMLQRTGRRLPKRMHARAEKLLAAEKLSSHPKLALQQNRVELSKAYDELRLHLEAIDVADRRKGKILSLAGSLAFNVLAVVAGFIFWLWWQGYV